MLCGRATPVKPDFQDQPQALKISSQWGIHRLAFLSDALCSTIKPQIPHVLVSSEALVSGRIEKGKP